MDAIVHFAATHGLKVRGHKGSLQRSHQVLVKLY